MILEYEVRENEVHCHVFPSGPGHSWRNKLEEVLKDCRERGLRPLGITVNHRELRRLKSRYPDGSIRKVLKREGVQESTATMRLKGIPLFVESGA